MTETEITLPPHITPARLLKAIERAIIIHALTPTLKGTLAQYPGSLHWHLTLAKLGGTLELTYWPASHRRTHRLWCKVARNRHKPWIDETIPLLKQSILSNL